MWISEETTTHQDHVIAHVVGSTVLGHFAFDETIYLLLDIGFMWQIYLDGEMGLLPGTLSIEELEVDQQRKQQLKSDTELLLTKGIDASGVQQVAPAAVKCLIEGVSFFRDGDSRRLILHGEENDLVVESSLQTRTIKLSVKQD
jgi:hypothetical protein